MVPETDSPELVAIGEAMAEFNQAGREGTVQEGFWQGGFGGDTSNAMIAAARSGAKTGFISAVGDDISGQALMELWRRENVSTQGVSVHPIAPTGVYFVTHGPQGHSFSYLRKGSAASLMRPQDLARPLLANAKILHVSGISQAISDSAADCVFEAIDIVKAAGGLVSYDPNLRLKLWPLARARAIIHTAMAQADIALPGLDDAQLLTGLDDPDAIADFYLKLGARIVALTLGKAGSLVATRESRARIPSIQVEAVDATGAGDTYDGAFLAQYLATGDAMLAGHFASVAAALSTRGYGAVAPMPKREDILAQMDGHNFESREA